MNLTSTKSVEVHVVEDHNDALPFIYRAIGAKRLAFDGLVLVHIDAHPDLGVPADLLDADEVYDAQALYAKLSIESWIMPAVYAGHIGTVVWVKPTWARQIERGNYRFVVGKCIRTGRIRCSCRERYFLGDATYAPETQLVNKRPVRLLVRDLTELDDDLAELIGSAAEKRCLVLDVDLDAFSTQDPFRVQLGDDYDLFKRVYCVRPPADGHDNEDFESAYDNYLSSKKRRQTLIWSVLNGDESSDVEEDVHRLKAAIERRKLDVAILHEFGSSCIDDSDSEPLPHHVSTDAELAELIGQHFERFVRGYFSLLEPQLVTVARSSLDDYCPPWQVDLIQAETLRVLQAALTIKEIKLHYLENDKND